ncbi:MAG TPA: glycosyltransferase family 2 protein, partial [Phormidium sp.]
MNYQVLEKSSTTLTSVSYSETGLLSSLPSPPDGHTGWPWTEQTPPLPSTLPDGKPWPKVTIVTPSYNQGEFIEETIRSVLLQNYPNLEYIVMDGGSTDNTVSILEKYANWISLWRSEKDNGQTHAINKGFERASGFLRGYLNSDDCFLPSSLEQVARLAGAHSEQPILILGNCQMGYSSKEIFSIEVPTPPVNLIDAISNDALCPQPATFWTQPENSIPHRFSERLVFSMDFEFWHRLIKHGYQVIKFDATLAFYRHHKDAKGSKITNVFWAELASLPLLEVAHVKSFKDKLYLTTVSRRRIRHY